MTFTGSLLWFNSGLHLALHVGIILRVFTHLLVIALVSAAVVSFTLVSEVSKIVSNLEAP